MNRSFIMLLALVLFLGAGFGGSFVGGVIYGETRAENAEEALLPRLGAGGQFTGGGQGAGGGQRGQGRQGQDGGPTAAPGQGEGFGGGQAQGGQASARQGGGTGAPGGSDVQAPGQGRAQSRENPQGQAPLEPSREGIGNPPNAEINQERQANQGGEAGVVGQGPGPSDTSTQGGAATEETPQGNANRGGATGAVQGLEGDVITLASPRGDMAVTLTETTRIFQVSETGREALQPETMVRVVGLRNPEGRMAAQSVVILPEGVEDLFVGVGRPGGRQRGQAP